MTRQSVTAHFRSIALGTLALLLLGCPGNPGGLKLAPVTTIDSTSLIHLGGVAVQTSGLANAGATLVVPLHDGTGNRIADGTVSLLGPTLGYGNSAASADLNFTPLSDGTYALRVSAPGFATQQVTGITLSASQSVTQVVTLATAGGTVTGNVVDGTGNPVWGAWVSDGLCDAITDAQGSYQLAGCPAGAQTLTVRKTGFASGQLPVTIQGATTAPNLTLQAAAKQLYLFNGNPGNFSQLLNLLSTNGFNVNAGSAADTWLIISPSNLPSGAAAQVANFVASGGKLIVMGEWGGDAGYNPDVLNAVLQPFGLFVNPDLVRSPANEGGRPEYPVISNLLAGNPASKNVASLGLFESASLYTVPPAVAMALPGAPAYQVMDVSSAGYLPVAAYTQSGKGLVVALGDSSAWSDSSTLGNGADLAQLGNKTFMLNLFDW